MTNAEKIARNVATIEKHKTAVAQLQEKIKKIEAENKRLEAAEIQGILEEYKVSPGELRAMLNSRG